MVQGDPGSCGPARSPLTDRMMRAEFIRNARIGGFLGVRSGESGFRSVQVLAAVAVAFTLRVGHGRRTRMGAARMFDVNLGSRNPEIPRSGGSPWQTYLARLLSGASLLNFRT